MRPAVRFSPQAQRELREALRAMEHASARKTLRTAVAEAARRLGDNPLLGSVRPYLPASFRFWVFPGFGFVMVYDPATDPLEVLRFVHTRRDLARVLADLRDPVDPEEAS